MQIQFQNFMFLKIKLAIVSVFIFLSLELQAQPDCINYSCDINEISWLQQIKDRLLDPNINPSIGGCTPSQTISQCDYKGQSVIVLSPGACLLADEPFSVFSCTQDFLFEYGGFCIGPNGGQCPGEIESQFISSCEVIFSVDEGDSPVCESNIIPTLGEWAIIILSFLFLIFGSIAIKENYSSILSSN